MNSSQELSLLSFLLQWYVVYEFLLGVVSVAIVVLIKMSGFQSSIGGGESRKKRIKDHLDKIKVILNLWTIYRKTWLILKNCTKGQQNKPKHSTVPAHHRSAYAIVLWNSLILAHFSKIHWSSIDQGLTFPDWFEQQSHPLIH